MPLSSSSPCLALLALLLALTGVASSRSRAVGGGATTDGAAVPQGDDELLMMERFHGWMAEHGRSYAAAEEKRRRFEIYRRNVEFIEAANRDGRLTYTLGENKFTDLTHEEFLATYTSRARRPDPTTEEEMVITTRAGHVREGASLPAAEDDVPDRVNWTAQGKVTGIKYQGKTCGSCWAFAAVATIESAYAIAKEVEPPVLSEQELIDCDDYDSGCLGGWPERAFRWLKRHGGLASASQYPPYDSKKHACRKEKRLPHAVSLRDYKYVSKGSEEELMKAVAGQPVAVGFNSDDECFRFYKSGVYNGMCVRDGVFVGPCSNDWINHDLAIVGYVGKGNDQDKYWIAKNSWGEDWGHERLRLAQEGCG
ncbi:hypothetical protein PVAP13_J325701 [Panicum virgatum]|nr:hypothetical protein PVAP13_J325701 [Panicum virgatum]